jgi:Sec-independent protein secretion pathway component TatC
MRNNPFITVILLFCIEILLYIYIDYTNLIVPSSEYAGLVMPIFCFMVPVIAFLIWFFVKDMAYKKEFRYFLVFLLIVSIIIFAALSFLTALGKAYQH